MTKFKMAIEVHAIVSNNLVVFFKTVKNDMILLTVVRTCSN